MGRVAHVNASCCTCAGENHVLEHTSVGIFSVKIYSVICSVRMCSVRIYSVFCSVRMCSVRMCSMRENISCDNVLTEHILTDFFCEKVVDRCVYPTYMWCTHIHLHIYLPSHRNVCGVHTSR